MTPDDKTLAARERRRTLWIAALLLTLLALLSWALAPRTAWAGGAGCAALAAAPGAVTLRAGGDLIVMAPHASAAAQVCYHNGDNVSRQGDYTLTLDTLTVQFVLDVGADETLHVRPPLGYMVFPADAAEARVHDGGHVTLLIVMGVS